MGIGLRYFSWNIVFLTGVFWVAVGTPLGLLLYIFILKLPDQLTALVILKLIVNGIFNALIASIIIVNTPLLEILSRDYKRSFPFRQTLFNALLAFTIIPVLILTIIGSRVQFQNSETQAITIIESISKEFKNNLEITQTYRWGDLNLFQALIEAKRSPYPINVFFAE